MTTIRRDAREYLLLSHLEREPTESTPIDWSSARFSRATALTPSIKRAKGINRANDRGDVVIVCTKTDTLASNAAQ